MQVIWGDSNLQWIPCIQKLKRAHVHLFGCIESRLYSRNRKLVRRIEYQYFFLLRFYPINHFSRSFITMAWEQLVHMYAAPDLIGAAMHACARTGRWEQVGHYGLEACQWSRPGALNFYVPPRGKGKYTARSDQIRMRQYMTYRSHQPMPCAPAENKFYRSM